MNANVSKTNGVKLLAVVAVLALAVCAFAAFMPSEATDATTSEKDPMYIGGTVDKLTEYTDGNTVVVDRDLIIISGGSIVIGKDTTFTINEGVTVTIQDGGKLIINKDAKAVTVNGDIVATDYGTIISVGTQFSDEQRTGGMKITSTGSITLEKGALLDAGEADLGSIILQNGATLDVTKSSSNISMIRSVEVILYEGSTFNLDGYVKHVTVRAIGDASYYTAGQAYLNNTYYEGGFSPLNNRDTSDLTFTVTTQTASAYTSDSDLSQTVTIRQYILNVDGTVDGIETGDNTYSKDSLTFQPGKSMKKVTPGNTYTTQTYYEVIDKETAGDAFVPTTSVTGTLDVGVNGTFSAASGTYTIVSGEVTFDYNDKKDATEGDNSASLNGYVYVSGTLTLNVENIKDTDGLSNGTLYVDGGKVTVYDADAGIFSSQPYGPIGMYGAAYETDGDNAALIICDFDVAITEAIAAEATGVYVMGLYDSSNPATVDDAVANGAYVIDTTVTVPEDVTIFFWNNVVINSDTVLTFADGSEAEVIQGDIYVDGKLVDQSGTFDYANMEDDVRYEVKKISDDELTTTYTTLAIALSEAVSGEKIELNGLVVIDENMTIPADVTVISDTEGLQITDGATLTIDGILDLNGATIAFTKDADNDNAADGKIVLNNIIVSTNDSYVATGGDNAVYTIPGAYYQASIDGFEGEYFVTSVPVAANNSASVEYGGITIVGNLSFGDVTFTKGTDSDSLEIIIADNSVISAGTVTLDGASMTIGETVVEKDTTSFTGTVVLKATDGDVSIQLSKAKYIELVLDPTDDGQSVTYDAQIGSSVDVPTRSPMLGEITIASGTITLVDDVRVVDLTISEGAELIIAEGNTLYADDDDAKYDADKMPIDVDQIAHDVAPVTVNGTLTVNGGLQWDFVVVNGTLAFGEKAVASFNADIHGTVDIAENAQVSMPVAIVYGTINGNVKTVVMLAYPDCDVTAAIINDNDADGDSDAKKTDFYLNGVQFVTFYTSLEDVPVTLMAYIANDPSILAGTGVFYSDEAMTDEIASIGTGFQNAAYTWITGMINDGSATPSEVLGKAYTDDYEVVYVSMDPALVNGTVSEGTGLNLFIDNVAFYPRENQGTTGQNYTLTVGTHTVRYDVSAGYDASNAIITFNGQTVENGGTIEITTDMIKDGFMLTVSGAVPSSGQVVIDNGSSSDMGLTDYLLIILVILIVVMAIMVAMRLMRS